jgi:hypothetical protein
LPQLPALGVGIRIRKTLPGENVDKVLDLLRMLRPPPTPVLGALQ